MREAAFCVARACFRWVRLRTASRFLKNTPMVIMNGQAYCSAA